MEKNIIIAIIFLGLSIVFLALTIVLPIVIKNISKNSTSKKTDLNSDNINLWGTFPGKLQSSIKHNFTFYDYLNVVTKSNQELPLSKSIVFNEEVKYEDYSKKDNEIFVNIKKKFTEVLSKSNNESIVLLPSLGYYEYVQAISNFPVDTKIMNGLKYLKENADFKEDSFTKKMYLIENQKDLLNKDFIKKNVLKSIPENEKDFIYEHITCGFKSLESTYKWIRLISDSSLISKATWLKEEFKMNDNEINDILGKDSYLEKQYLNYLNKLYEKFKCKKNECKFIYRQIVDNSVLDEKSEIGTISLLNTKIHPSLSFIESPEMKLYYSVSEFKDKISFDELKLDFNQLYSLFDQSNKNSLYNPNITYKIQNSIQNKVLTKELKDLFKFKSVEQEKFLFDYISDYVPKLYYFYTFVDNKVKYQISQPAKLPVKSIQNYITKQYKEFLDKRDFLYTTLLFDYFKEVQKISTDLDDICPVILQPILNDGKKVFKICQDKKINITSVEGFNNWIQAYFCYANGKGRCNVDIKNYFMSNKNWAISETEMKRIFNGNNEGIKNTFETVYNKMKEKYECAGTICTSTELYKKQYLYSTVTLNLPECYNKTSYTLNDIYPNIFDKKFELSYKQNSMKVKIEDLSDKLKASLINLYNPDNDIFLDDYSDGLLIKHDLEIIYTLYQKQITSSDYSKKYDINDISEFIKFINKLVTGTNIKANDNLTKYKLKSVIFGNNDEDSQYVKLISNGNYYEGYKPGFKKTTGFNLPMNEYQHIGSYKLNYEKNNRFRNILLMNGFSYYNIKKEIYSPSENKTADIYINLYKSGNLSNNNDWVSDGFQYSVASTPKSIYYYDFLSGRRLQFDHSKYDIVNDIECEKYVLNNNLVQNMVEPDDISGSATVYQKFNKPFVIATESAKFEYNIKKNNKESYICVDPISYMVIKSDINIIYAINTTESNSKESNKILKEGLLPLIYYNRNYNIYEKEYNNAFTEIKTIQTTRIIIIALGIVIIVIFINLCVYYYLKKSKDEKEDPSLNSDKSHEDLIPNTDKSDTV